MIEPRPSPKSSVTKELYYHIFMKTSRIDRGTDQRRGRGRTLRSEAAGHFQGIERRSGVLGKTWKEKAAAGSGGGDVRWSH